MVIKSVLATKAAAMRDAKSAQRKKSREIIQKRRNAPSKIIRKKASIIIPKKSTKRGPISIPRKPISKKPSSINRTNLMNKSRASSLANMKSANIRRAKVTRNRELVSANNFAIRKFNQLNKNRKIADRSVFTVAVPIGRDRNNVIIQDYTFRFNKRRLVKSKKLKGNVSINKNDFERRTGVRISR